MMAGEKAVPLPTRIGARYDVLEQLGRGGMAVVYRVRDVARGVELALKQLLLPPDPIKAREIGALFEHEFYTLAQLSHPGVVDVYDYGIDPGGAYYTMELVDGGDLSEGAPWPYPKACALLAEVCSALSLLHSRRLVHRDITPRNIRCTRDGRAKLIDFGAMVPMGPSSQSVGTPAFISPEALHQLSLDGRTDLYSLGATLYYALTKRTPFSPRSFSELRDLWRNEPLPPSQLSASIPPALDALVLGLLRIDPAQRPRSAFEVMQRLSVLAGIERAERADIVQAYLATPSLIGREAEQAEFRTLCKRASRGRGGGLSIEGTAGLGRSRMLDACVLEAKTLGAAVVRIAGGAASIAPFSSALKLAEQLLETSPELAWSSAREAGVVDVLFSGGAQEPPPLRAASELKAERHVLQAAFTRWFHRACHDQTLVIAADDAERIDHATLGLLAGLANDARSARLVLLIAVLRPRTPGLAPALDLLREHCKVLALAPLTRAQSDALFSSVFGNVPHVALVSERVHALTAGVPRDSMALAGHLLDTERIRYADGNWILPAELHVADLPSDAAEALRGRIENLPELARRLAELQALALPGGWTRADFAELAGPVAAGRVDEALNALLRQNMLASDGLSYTLANEAVRASFVNRLSAADRAERHFALAEQCARRGRFGLPEVHHLLLAGAEQRALDRFAELIVEVADRTDFLEASGMHGDDIAAAFERGYALAVKYRRSAREIAELARHLTALAIVSDNRLHARYGLDWGRQLARDSGLDDYRACDPALDSGARLQQAVQRALARYEATPEAERVYRLDEAIKYLARYVTISVAIGMRERDTKLLAEIPSMLEPFAPLSPIVNALWQNALSAYEMNFRGQPARARKRALAVYEQLSRCQGDELRYVDMIRHAVATAVASLDLTLGHPTLLDWIAIAEKDAMHQVNALWLLRLNCIMNGDPEQAEQLRRRAEVLTVQASSRQMFTPPMRYEIVAQARLGDLAAVKHVYDEIAQLAVASPGWRSQEHFARGVYQAARGDHLAARDALEQCLALTSPDQTDPPPCLATWTIATAYYLSVLAELGELERARELGLSALARCRELEVDAPAFDIVRELALIEARLGQHERAARRIDELIAGRANLLERHRALDYDVRARIAIEARDRDSLLRFTQLTASEYDVNTGSGLLARQNALLEQARRAGMDVEISSSAFETSVLGRRDRSERSQLNAKLNRLFADAREPSQRAARVIEALCDSAEACAGVLYYADGTDLAPAASSRSEAGPKLDAFARFYWQEQLKGSDASALTVAAPALTQLPSRPTWLGDGDELYQLMLLKCVVRDTPVYVGIAALQIEDGSPPKHETWELASALCLRLLDLGDVTGTIPD